MAIIKHFLIFALVLLNGVVAEVDNEQFEDADDYDDEHRSLIVKPLWWEPIRAAYEGTDLRGCFQRQVKPPKTGMKCSVKVKTCFFGDQQCEGDVPFPTSKCHCDGNKGTQKWVCEDTQCPTGVEPPKTLEPPAVTTNPAPVTPGIPIGVDEKGCPLEGLGFEILNDPKCPATSNDALGNSCTAEQDSLSCNWGEETCCGNCNPSMTCTCMGGSWGCYHTDACMFPQCDTHDWSSLKGETCADATASIFVKFPNMDVVCITSADTMPTDDDLARYVIVTGSDGAVTDIVFNRNAECPAPEVFKNDKSCSVTGQQCDFETDSSTATAICTTTHQCTCQFGSFECGSVTMACVSRDPPSISACPTLEAYQAGTTACPVDGHACEYEYKSTTDTAICNNKDSCVCSDSELACTSAPVTCVSKNPPSFP